MSSKENQNAIKQLLTSKGLDEVLIKSKITSLDPKARWRLQLLPMESDDLHGFAMVHYSLCKHDPAFP